MMSPDDLVAKRVSQLGDLAKARQDAQDCLAKARENAAALAKGKVRTNEIDEGDLVLMDVQVQTSFKNRKLEERFSGPYRVKRKFENNTYVLEELDGRERRSIEHVNHLWRFY